MIPERSHSVGRAPQRGLVERRGLSCFGAVCALTRSSFGKGVGSRNIRKDHICNVSLTGVIYADRDKRGINSSVVTCSDVGPHRKIFLIHSVGKLKRQVRCGFVDSPVACSLLVHRVVHRLSALTHSNTKLIHRGCG